MIRIRISHTSGGSRLHVEGEVAGEFTDELARCWLSTRAPDNYITVNLSGVIHVDRRGRRLLQQMYANQVEFIGAGLAVQDILNEIKTKQLSIGDN